MPLREAGYYRIQLRDGNWIIAEWIINGASTGWYIHGDENVCDDEEWEEIGERIVFRCGWKEDFGSSITTDCGENHKIYNQKIISRAMQFCPYCGGKIVWK